MTDITERLRSLYVQHGTDYVQEAAGEIERLRAENDRLTAQITAFKDGWMRVIDTELVITHMGIAEPDDDYITAKTKLLRLIDWYVSMRTDPAMNGGRQLVPIEPTREMLFAGGNNAESGQNFEAYLPSECAAIYRDMLAAAPKPGEE